MSRSLSDTGLVVMLVAVAAVVTTSVTLLGRTTAPPAAASLTQVTLAQPTRTAVPREASVPGPTTSPPTPTPVPTAVPPTPTSAPARGVVAWSDSFGDNRRGWPNDPQSTAWFVADGYRVEPRVPGRFAAVTPAEGPALRDVRVTANVRKLDRPPGGTVGIVLRAQAPALDGTTQAGRYYVLGIGDRGEVGIWRRDNDRWIDLQPRTPSPAVHLGAADNEIQAEARGNQLRLTVNGVLAAEVDDASLQAGSVGVYVGGDGDAAVFANVVVEQLS